MYASTSEDKAIFGPILEKAFAKYHGNYEHIIGGNPASAIKTLYGAPWTQLEHKDVDEDTLWNTLKASDENDNVIQCGTMGNNHFMKGGSGLAMGHAYTVLGVKELTDADGKAIRLVKMRNPWGSETYNSDYSDNSPLWTDDLRK